MRNDEFVEFEETLLLDNKNLAKLTLTQSQENIIKRLYLSFNQIDSLPKNMKELVFIDLSNNKIGSTLPDQITEALSSYPNLNQLCLKQNQLENINNLQNSSLQVFQMTQNRFRQFPEKLFTNFPQLQSLDLDHNFLYTFSSQKSETIRELSLSLNCIENVDLETLNFPQLVSLDLSKNRITKIPNNFSKSFPKLQSLQLNDNLIAEIPENSDGNDPVFPETLNLLNLSNNFIEKIPNSITKIKYLTELNIENNKITHIPKLNGTLKYFRASNNKISSVDDQELNFLNEITLFNNELKTYPIQIKTFRSKLIRLDRNEIKEINFGNVPINRILTTMITEVNISFNQIEIIPKEFFEKLPNLQTFSAFFNKITEIPTEISNCQRLVNLNISHNPIKKLPKLPKSLKKLTASNCQIESIDPETFSSNLRLIDLSCNNLQSFTSTSSIQILNLSQNKIKVMPSVTENLQILDLSMNQIESNQEFIACFSLVDFNLSYNKLTEIPRISYAPDLKYFEISGNPIKGKLNITNFPSLNRIDISNTEIEIVGLNSILNEVIASQTKEKENKTTTENENELNEEEENSDDEKENKTTAIENELNDDEENEIELNDEENISDDEKENLATANEIELNEEEEENILGDEKENKAAENENEENKTTTEENEIEIELNYEEENISNDEKENLATANENELNEEENILDDENENKTTPEENELNDEEEENILGDENKNKTTAIENELNDDEENEIELNEEEDSSDDEKENNAAANENENKLNEEEENETTTEENENELNNEEEESSDDEKENKTSTLEENENKLNDKEENETTTEENKNELNNEEEEEESSDDEHESVTPNIEPILVNQGKECRSGYSEFVGMRSNMEDSVIVRDDLNLYAVCDGHGGSDTSKFACIQISELFEKAKPNYTYDTASNHVLEIVRNSVESIRNMALRDGSTLCLAFLCQNELNKKRKIVTAHLGDSRALIVRSDGNQRELTKDHKPSIRSEFERVHNEFGLISKKNRLDGVLAVTRSIGDYDVNGVGREPEMNEFELDENDKFLVICCDGVFDVLTNDDLASLIVNAQSANDAAYSIRNAAFSSLSIDNITAIVVDLQNCN